MCQEGSSLWCCLHQGPLWALPPGPSAPGRTRCSPAVLRMPTIRTASGGTGWLLNMGSRPGLGGGVL